jgi:hypothetical protein
MVIWLIYIGSKEIIDICLNEVALITLTRQFEFLLTSGLFIYKP